MHALRVDVRGAIASSLDKRWEGIILSIRRGVKTMAVDQKVARKALGVFRKEQKKRTIGTYTGCFCDGCVECMKLAIEAVEDELKGR